MLLYSNFYYYYYYVYIRCNTQNHQALNINTDNVNNNARLFKLLTFVAFIRLYCFVVVLNKNNVKVTNFCNITYKLLKH